MKQGMSKGSKKLILIGGLGLALIIIILAIVNSLMPKPEELGKVGAISAENDKVEELLDLTGTVKSMTTKTFFSPVNAKLDKLDAESGEVVKKGTPLVEFDLKDLEKNNEKAELNVRTGELDTQEAINQDKKNIDKKANARANAGTLQGAVDQWQAYVDNLKAAINDANVDAQNGASANAQAQAEQQQQEYESGLANYQTAFAQYQQQCDTSYADYQSKFTVAQTAQHEYDVAYTVWQNDPTTDNEQKVNSANTKKITAQNDENQAWEGYEAVKNNEPQLAEYVSAGGSMDSSGAVVADTYDLQAELERASTYLAELKGDLASEKAKADAEMGELSDETKQKMKIGTDLAEMESKTIEELIEEGKKGIQAEFTGVITDVRAQEGATVAQGMELFTLQSTEDVSVEVKVSKYDYAKVKEGQKATITMGGHEYQGTVTKIDRVALPDETGSPAVKATVHIDNPDDNVFIGVEAKVIIQVAEANDTLVVPSEGVNIGKEGSFCYVIEDNTIVKRSVETGITSATKIEIKSGLKKGDQVITDIGAYAEGDRVEGVDPSELSKNPMDDMIMMMNQ